ncbi:MAG: GYD domain-containing protein [Methanobacteriota archaeon]
MPHYISLLKWTDQGIKSVKESPKRADAAKSLVQSLGGKMDIFYTLGEYDAVAVSEAPNDETVLQALLQLGSQGNIRSTTLKAWSVDEATRVLAKLK